MGRTFFRLLEQPIERLLSLSALNQLYSDMFPDVGDRSYFATALRGLGVEYDLAPEDLEVFKRAATQQPAQNPLERRRGDFHHGLQGRHSRHCQCSAQADPASSVFR